MSSDPTPEAPTRKQKRDARREAHKLQKESSAKHGGKKGKKGRG